MEQLICHMTGDFPFQSTWMATNKYQTWWPAVVHALVYTAWFLLLTKDPADLAIIGVTHLLIDHYRLAAVWARFINWDWKSPQPVIPAWCIVAIDQWMHLTINWLVLR